MRNLEEHEKHLIKELLSQTELEPKFSLDSGLVIDLNDGGMGSIQFVSPSKASTDRSLFKEIAAKTFIDNDLVPISVSLTIDEDGNLYELDIWKADFSPVLKYPS